MDSVLIAARALHFAATVSLCGLFAFRCLVVGPVIRQSGAEPLSAARLDRHFGWLGWASLSLALLSGAAWLALEAARMSGQPFAAVLASGTLATVLTRTRFGHDWLLRLFLAALLGLCFAPLRRRRGPASVAVAWIGLGLSALMLATLAWAGHGAATPGEPGDLHLAADILHLLAAGAWLGTLIPLALLLAEARRAGGASWAAIVRAVVRRFSLLAAVSVATLLAAGIVNTWFLAGAVPALVGTEYGRLLLAKIGLFAAMVAVAAVNLFRLSPRLADRSDTMRLPIRATIGQLRRNAVIEAIFGIAILVIVGALGVLPPGLHTEPGWPLPFRLDLDALTRPAAMFLAILAGLFCVCVVIAVIAAAAGNYRRAAAPLAGLVLSLGLGWMVLRPAMERAYPTTYYVPAEAYAAPSIARGRLLYGENCALCHGATGRGDGPAAAGLPTRPADLTAPHLFAHQEGDLYWWVSHGSDSGAMPGFAAVIGARGRWDVINFIRAQAAGVMARDAGPNVTEKTAAAVPDFAFDKDGRQLTLGAVLQGGPVLLVLFTPPAPMPRLAKLAAAQRRFRAAGLTVLAVGVGPRPAKSADRELPSAAVVVAVSAEAASTLALFGTADEVSELMLDRAGNVRARWTGSLVADPDTLLADAERVARLAAAPPSHAGHPHRW